MIKKTLTAAALITAVAFTGTACGTTTETVAPQTKSSVQQKTTTTKKVEKKAAPKLSVAREQAVLAAKTYLETMPFSKKGLIKQLKFDKHSAADAKYAANHVKANWNKQAEKAAASYLDTMPMSQADLVTQLEFDGFTSAQAEHGASNAFKK